MKSFPSYLQHDAMDCGPTCLRMISAFHGRNYSLEGLREKANLTHEGVSLLGISEAAEQIGFRSMGVSLSFEDLKEAQLPCVVHWNQAHFVVVYKDNKVSNTLVVGLITESYSTNSANSSSIPGAFYRIFLES